MSRKLKSTILDYFGVSSLNKNDSNIEPRKSDGANEQSTSESAMQIHTDTPEDSEMVCSTFGKVYKPSIIELSAKITV